MNRKGFSLIELIVAIFIFSLIVLTCSSIYTVNIKSFNYMDECVEERVNLRIAMDFLADLIRDGQSIVIEGNNVTIDGKRIYLINNILRYHTDSQQIANNVTSFKVSKLNENGLYNIILTSGKYSLNTLIKKRKL